MKKIIIAALMFISLGVKSQVRGLLDSAGHQNLINIGAIADTSRLTPMTLTGVTNRQGLQWATDRFVNYTPNYWRIIGDTGLSRTLNYMGSSDTSEVHIKQNGIDVITINGSQQTGIGTTAPAYTLDVQKVGTGASAPIFNLFGYGTGTGSGGYIILGGSAGTSIGSLAATPDLKALGTIDFLSINSSNARATSARIQAIQTGSAGATFNAARLGFFTGTAAATITEKLTIDNTGDVGIGTTAPNSLALLDVSSTTKGILIPRFTTAQMNAVVSPPDGLIIYLTDSSAPFFYNGPATAWYNLRGAGASGTVITGGAQSFSGLKTFSTGIVAGTITTTATAANSNLGVSSGATVANATTTAQLKSSANNVMYRVAIRGSTSTVTTANTDVWALDIGDNNFTEAISGTVIEAGGLFVATQTFVDGVGSTTDFQNVLIGNKPASTATNNYALNTGFIHEREGHDYAYIAKATSYTATASDNIIEVTATGQTITLPTAVGCAGRCYVIKLTASGSCTVATTSSQNIDASTTFSLSAQYKYVRVISNNAAWIITANN